MFFDIHYTNLADSLQEVCGKGRFMKIAVIGHSGSGKSTLARRLGAALALPVLHLDSVQFLPGWQERAREEQCAIVEDFLDKNSGWVIDGNYSKVAFARRMAEADRILLLDFPRRICLPRVVRRWRQYRGRTRPDMGEGCTEKLDWPFLRWVLWEGRTPAQRERWANLEKQYPDKVLRLTRPRQVELAAETISQGKGVQL